MIDEQLGIFQPQESSNNPKELFDSEDIDVKTELKGEQVLIVSKIRFLSRHIHKKFGVDMLDGFVDDFLRLQVSKDRGSRKEFVSAFQSRNDERMGGMIDKLGMNIGGNK